MKKKIFSAVCFALAGTLTLAAAPDILPEATVAKRLAVAATAIPVKNGEAIAVNFIAASRFPRLKKAHLAKAMDGELLETFRPTDAEQQHIVFWLHAEEPDKRIFSDHENEYTIVGFNSPLAEILLKRGPAVQKRLFPPIRMIDGRPAVLDDSHLFAASAPDELQYVERRVAKPAHWLKADSKRENLWSPYLRELADPAMVMAGTRNVDLADELKLKKFPSLRSDLMRIGVFLFARADKKCEMRVIYTFQKDATPAMADEAKAHMIYFFLREQKCLSDAQASLKRTCRGDTVVCSISVDNIDQCYNGDDEDDEDNDDD